MRINAAYPPATRIVDDWSTRCNNCGKPSNLGARHAVILGYGDDNGEAGCGIVYEYEVSVGRVRSSAEMDAWGELRPLPSAVTQGAEQ